MPSTFEPAPPDSVNSSTSEETPCAQCAHEKECHEFAPGCLTLVPGEHGRLRQCRCAKYVTPLAPFKPVIAHPNDVCDCGHKRSEHTSPVPPTGGSPCRVPCGHGQGCQQDHCFGYADGCIAFRMAKTALQVAVDDLQVAVDDLTIPESQDENELCGCGHAALVHAKGAGNCLALGTSSQEDSHCLEFRPQSCGGCGHDMRDHNRRGECRDTTCACAPAHTERPVPTCQCDTGDTHTYGSPQCLVFWTNATNEDNHVAEQTEAWEATPDPLPQVLPQPVPAYRVIYATAGGTLHAIDVPYGVNVSVIDGQLRLWHAGSPILAIQANITSTEESR